MAGFFKNSGQFLGNAAKGYIDANLGMVGLDNVIQDDAYSGTGSELFKTGANISGQVGKAALPFALQTVGVPMQATQAAQGVIGGFNPEDSSVQPMPATTAPNPYYNSTNMIPQQTYAQNYAYGGYVKGRIRGYWKGGVVGQGQISDDNWAGAGGPGIVDQIQTQTTDTYSVPNAYETGYGSQINYGINPNGMGGGSFSQQPGNYQPFATQGATQDVAKASGLNPYIAAGTLGLGAYQLYQSNKALKQLGKEAMPSYSANPALTSAYQRAQQMSQRGYTPEQEAAFKGNLATNQNTSYRNAVSQSGGNLAQAINAGLQSQNIGALNQFAADDASKRQQNIQYADSFAPRFQNIQDENTRNALQYRIMREQALGAAKAQAQSNLAQGANATLASISQLYSG